MNGETNMDKLRYCKTRDVKSPNRGTPGSAGIDFYVPFGIDEDTMNEKCDITGCFPEMTFEDNKLMQICLKPGESVMIPSGIKMKVPDGNALAFMNKSGQAAKKQLDRLAELVDSDYEGEVHLNIVNNGNSVQYIKAGDKLIQGVILPINFAEPEEVSTVEELFANSDSLRKTGGFGSTGNN